MMKEEISGCYMILCNKNWKYYIGSSKDIENRWNHHIKELKKKKHINDKLQNAWNKYGEESFSLIILEKCFLEFLSLREQFYIDYFHACNCGFNINPHSDRPRGWKGRKRKSPTKETRRKLSESNKRAREDPEILKKISERTKEALSDPCIRKKMSESIRIALSNPEVRKKMVGRPGPNLGKFGENHPSFGRNRSIEARKKMSKSMKGKNKGKKHSDETKRKISEGNKGKKKNRKTNMIS